MHTLGVEVKEVDEGSPAPGRLTADRSPGTGRGRSVGMSPVNARTVETSKNIEEVARILTEKCESILVSDARNCIGCRACVKSCRKKGGSMLAGRWITCGTLRIAPVCRTCESPRCVQACRQSAIRKVDGRVLIDAKTCIKCGRCVKMCPFGLIHMYVTGESGAKSSTPREPGKPAAGRINPKEISKCDQCIKRGLPACVNECPTGTLRFVDHATFRALVEAWQARMQEATGGHQRLILGREVAFCRTPLR